MVISYCFRKYILATTLPAFPSFVLSHRFAVDCVDSLKEIEVYKAYKPTECVCQPCSHMRQAWCYLKSMLLSFWHLAVAWHVSSLHIAPDALAPRSCVIRDLQATEPLIWGFSGLVAWECECENGGVKWPCDQ